MLEARLTCDGADLVQLKSGALADLAYLRKKLFISSIKAPFMCIRFPAGEQDERLPFHEFDNAKMATANAYLLPIQPSTQMRTYALCARGVEIDTMPVFHTAAVATDASFAAELRAVVIYGRTATWLVLLRKCGMYWPLEPAHFMSTTQVHLHLTLAGVFTAYKFNVTEVGMMPHRMVCAQLALALPSDALLSEIVTAMTVDYNGYSLQTLVWHEPEMQASDFNDMSSDDIKARITDCWPDLKARIGPE